VRNRKGMQKRARKKGVLMMSEPVRSLFLPLSGSREGGCCVQRSRVGDSVSEDLFWSGSRTDMTILHYRRIEAKHKRRRISSCKKQKRGICPKRK
jgi:hypothetical protein